MPKHDPLAIREAIQEKAAAAEAIVQLAENESRDLTETDNDEFGALLTEIGVDDGDKSTGLYKQLHRAERLEEIQLALKAPVTNSPEPVAEKPDPMVRSLGFSKSGPLRAFKGPGAEQEAYTAGMWLKAILLKDKPAADWCRDRGVGFSNAQTEGTASEGGYTVPDPLSDAVLEARDAIGVTGRISERFFTDSDTLKIPTIVSGQTVQYPGEATAITASDVVWGQVSCAIIKRAVLTKISWELINDSLVNVADRVASRAGYALGARQDEELINGDGTSAYGSVTGLVSDLGAAGKVTMSSGNTTYEDVTLANLNAVCGKLPDRFHTGASWLMNRAFFAEAIQRLVYASGGNTVQNVADGSGAQLFGYPINFSEAMPAEAADKTACFFGNFRESIVLAERTGIDVMTSEHAYFAEDVLAMKLVSRYDIQVHRPGDGSSAGGYTALMTAAS